MGLACSRERQQYRQLIACINQTWDTLITINLHEQHIVLVREYPCTRLESRFSCNVRKNILLEYSNLTFCQKKGRLSQLKGVPHVIVVRVWDWRLKGCQFKPRLHHRGRGKITAIIYQTPVFLLLCRGSLGSERIPTSIKVQE